MTQEQLTKITKYIANDVIRNNDYIFAAVKNEKIFELFDIIATLHNLLCQEVTGNRYNYMMHWSNKEGYTVEDDIFDDLLHEIKEEKEV